MARPFGKVATLAVAALLCVAASANDILIFGGADHDKFIGCLNCDKFSSDSIWNDLSTHGWYNQFGDWNGYGPYKNSYSNTSACNDYASNPPIIVDRSGTSYGYLTISEYKSGSVCGLSGAPQLCQALKVMCASK